jgi:hypothetical protein
LTNGLDRRRSLFERAVLDPGAWRIPGAVYSLMVHTAVLTGLLVLALTGVLPELTHPRAEVPRSRIDLSEVVFLPVLGGGAGEAGASTGGDEGLAHSGPQAMLSEFPDPTNSDSQTTVLRPGISEPGVLDSPPDLPNMVQLRDRPPVVQVVPPGRDVVYLPDLQAGAQGSPSDPTLSALAAAIEALPADPDPLPERILPSPLIRTLGAVPPRDLTPLAAERSPLQPLPARSVDLALPTRTFPVALPIFSLDTVWVRPDLTALATPRTPVEPLPVSWRVEAPEEELLTLSPTPADRRVSVPEGEVRGAFAISPTPNPDTAEAVPGADVRGSGKGVGDGTGNGNGAGGPFPGITILAGGVVASPPSRDSGVEARIGADDSSREANPPGFLQRSYGVTVVTTESSGGGLPDFGVFADEQVHTVFVDMRQEVDDPAPAWTAAYGVPEGTHVEDSGNGAGFQLPFPLERSPLELPEETVARYYQRRIVAYAVVDTAGNLTDIAIMETPAPALAGPVLKTLSGWRFRPARLDGELIPVKVLLGIPIWTPR